MLQQRRIASIDLLRGLVMIIMALDHVRDYFHSAAYLYDPTDLDKASIPLFFTRWITHFCAPVFMFLAGCSDFQVGQRKSKAALSTFLAKRGIWLILLELTVVNFGWNFDVLFTNIYFIVIWALGISMILLAVLIHLPFRMILVTGLLIVFGHNLLDNVHVATGGPKGFLWALIHDVNFFHPFGRNILVAYSILPWCGIMALGYCLGALYLPSFSAPRRKKMLIALGSGAIVLFLLLRLINGYGDPAPWSPQPEAARTILSFLKVTKYPASLCYTLMTLGPALLFLALTEQAQGAISRIMSVYGRVPMFYYLLHIYLIHLLTLLATLLFTDFSWKIWILREPLWFTSTLKGYGFSLGVVYLVWLTVVVVLYPLCRRYDHYKQAHRGKWWLSYL